MFFINNIRFYVFWFFLFLMNFMSNLIEFCRILYNVYFWWNLRIIGCYKSISIKMC